MDDLVILQKIYDMILWATPIVENYPRSKRFTLGTYTQNACSRGEATPADLNTTWQSYRGMLKHCNSYRLQRKLEAEIGKLN